MSHAQDRIGAWIGWAFFADLVDALALTFGYMFSRSVTMQYPDKEKWLPYSRYRGHHFLKRDEEGDAQRAREHGSAAGRGEVAAADQQKQSSLNQHSCQHLHPRSGPRPLVAKIRNTFRVCAHWPGLLR